MSEPTYPEHEKLSAIQYKSQTIGEFLDWLRGEKAIVLCRRQESTIVRVEDGWEGDPAGYYPAALTAEGLLTEYFGIDQERIEREKRAMLAKMREIAGHE